MRLFNEQQSSAFLTHLRKNVEVMNTDVHGALPSTRRHIANRRIVRALLMVLALFQSAVACAGQPAPRFSVQTLDGEVLSNDALRGQVVLLQFWATWCGFCRREQPVVDNLDSVYSSSGLVVLAIDVGESEETVRKYLQGHPRACRVAQGDHSLAAQFGVNGLPHYVVIDRNGNIAGTQSGAGGEGSLHRLLGRAGLSRSAPADAGGNPVKNEPSASGPQMITVRRERSAAPAKPLPKTIFIFANGERLESDRYIIRAKSLQVMVGEQQREFPLSALDIKKTLAVNRERGIELHLPSSGSEIYLAF